MLEGSMSVAVRLSAASRAQLDLLMARWGVPMSEAIRRAVWLCWRAEAERNGTQVDAQPSLPPADGASQ